MLRLLTSINWVVGSLALVVAFIYPFVHENLIVSVTQAVGKGTIDQLAKAQRDHFVRFEKYVYFPTNGPKFEKAMRTFNINDLNRDFDFEAYSNDKNALVIRATASTGLLRKGWVGPMVYEYKIKSEGDTGSGDWRSFSSKTPGLF
tara:strand:- start:31 stop:468 length:438 start_codon:yes stop_codon:yes gene_type:complete